MTHLFRRSLVSLVGLTLITTLCAETPVSAPPPAPVVSIGGEKLVAMGFETLSAFPYTIVDAGSGASANEIAEAIKHDQIPAWMRAYDGKRVVLTGYMVPLQLADGRARTLLLMKDVTTCCYGAIPKMNDYVVVEMKGAGVEPNQDVPVQLTGVLHIAEKRENGYIVSLFQMEGDKYLGPKP